MESIHSRNGLWQTRITRQGQAHIARSIQTKQEAERWAKQTEAEMDKGSFVNLGPAEKTQFKDIIERYIEEVTLKTRGRTEHTYQLRALTKRPIAK